MAVNGLVALGHRKAKTQVFLSYTYTYFTYIFHLTAFQHLLTSFMYLRSCLVPLGSAHKYALRCPGLGARILKAVCVVVCVHLSKSVCERVHACLTMCACVLSQAEQE